MNYKDLFDFVAIGNVVLLRLDCSKYNKFSCFYTFTFFLDWRGQSGHCLRSH